MNAALESLMPDAETRPRVSDPMRDLVMFVAVGGSGALAYVALTSAATALPLPAPRWVVSALCYASLVVPVYLAHRRFSFRTDARHRVALPRYVAVQAMAVTLAALFSWLCFSVFGLASPLGSVIVVTLTSGINFVVLRAWAFASGGRSTGAQRAT